MMSNAGRAANEPALEEIPELQGDTEITYRRINAEDVYSTPFGYNQYLFLKDTELLQPSFQVTYPDKVNSKYKKIFDLHDAIVLDVQHETNQVTILTYSKELKSTEVKTHALSDMMTFALIYRPINHYPNHVNQSEVLAIANLLKIYGRFKGFFVMCQCTVIANLCKTGRCSSKTLVNNLMDFVLDHALITLHHLNRAGIEETDLDMLKSAMREVATKTRAVIGIIVGLNLAIIELCCQEEINQFTEGEIDIQSLTQSIADRIDEVYEDMLLHECFKHLHSARNQTKFRDLLNQTIQSASQNLGDMECLVQNAAVTIKKAYLAGTLKLMLRIAAETIDDNAGAIVSGVVSGTAKAVAKGAARASAIGLAISAVFELPLLTVECILEAGKKNNQEITQRDFDDFVGERVARTIGNLGGGVGGAVAGAVIGAPGGPIGIGVGAAIGGIVGSAVGFGLGFGAGKAGVVVRDAVEGDKTVWFECRVENTGLYIHRKYEIKEDEEN